MKKEDFIKEFDGLSIPEEKLNAAFDKVNTALVEAHKGVTNRTLTEAETELAAFTSIPKEATETMSAYAKRLITASKNANQQEIATLKIELSEAKKNGANAQQIAEIKASLESAKANIEKELNEKKAELEDYKFDLKFKTLTDGKTINPAIPQMAVESTFKAVKEILKKVAVVEGTEFLKDANNNVLKNDKGEIYTFETYAAALLSDLFVKQGAQGNGSDDSAGKTIVTVTDIKLAKNRTQALDLTKRELLSKGFMPNSVEYKTGINALMVSEAYKKLNY